jgi:hypothetical protein
VANDVGRQQHTSIPDTATIKEVIAWFPEDQHA